MDRILVSACLYGERVRFDAADATCADARFAAWREQGRLVPICPEVVGGLSVPRPRARIVDGRVVADDGSPDGRDVTADYLRGAHAAVALARQHGIRLAILKQNSPSCGCRTIFTPDFRGRVPGEGLTARLLRENGVTVFGDDELDSAAAWLAANGAAQ
jgi:uncharacterized protein YbbK (DUF523 family)